MATLYLLIERAKRAHPRTRCAHFAHFSTCHTPRLAPTLHQACNVQAKQKTHKLMKHNLISLGFFTLTTADSLALSQLTLTLPEALCVMALFLWSTVLLWRSLLS